MEVLSLKSLDSGHRKQETVHLARLGKNKVSVVCKNGSDGLNVVRLRVLQGAL